MGAYDLVVVRSTWDYTFALAAVPGVDARGRRARLLNPPDVIAWNADKRYLADLAAAGVSTIATEHLAPGAPFTPPPGRFVVKPAVAGGARGAAGLRRASATRRPPRTSPGCTPAATTCSCSPTSTPSTATRARSRSSSSTASCRTRCARGRCSRSTSAPVERLSRRADERRRRARARRRGARPPHARAVDRALRRAAALRPRRRAARRRGRARGARARAHRAVAVSRLRARLGAGACARHPRARCPA